MDELIRVAFQVLAPLAPAPHERKAKPQNEVIDLTMDDCEEVKTKTELPFKPTPGLRCFLTVVGNKVEHHDIGDVFLFRTGIRYEIQRPGQELCAVSHKRGKWTLKWLKPPVASHKIFEKRLSATSITWQEAGTDLVTGLPQLDGQGENKWGLTLACLVGFLIGDIWFNDNFDATYKPGRKVFASYCVQGFESPSW